MSDKKPPLVIENFLTPEECEFMISFIDNYDFPESDKRSLKNNPLRIQIVNPENLKIKEIALRALSKVREVSGDNELLVGDFAPGVYTAPSLALNLHLDNHDGEYKFVQSACLYFNTEFEGGEIFFPDFEFIHKPKAGELIIFDSLYPHAVRPMKVGKRYLVATWFVHNRDWAWEYLLD
jgi:hypothetical protein